MSELVVFHWIMNSYISPRVSRTLFGFLADLNNAVVSRVSNLPLISNFPNLFPTFLGPFQAHRFYLLLPSSSCFTTFFVLNQVPSIYLSLSLSLYIYIYIYSHPQQQQRPFVNIFIPYQLPECSIRSRSFALCKRRPKIPSPECSTPMGLVFRLR